MARALRASGVEPGNRVAYLMPNLPEMLVAHFAVPLAGGVLVAINTRLTGEEVVLHPAPLGGEGPGRRGRAPLLPVALAGGDGNDAVRTLVVATDAEAGSADPDLNGPARAGELPRVCRPPGSRSAALVGPGRADPHHDQLHLRHHRQAEGRDLHPPRRLHELVSRRSSIPGRTRTASICGRCRWCCSTATAGAPRGR